MKPGERFCQQPDFYSVTYVTVLGSPSTLSASNLDRNPWYWRLSDISFFLLPSAPLLLYYVHTVHTVHTLATPTASTPTYLGRCLEIRRCILASRPRAKLEKI